MARFPAGKYGLPVEFVNDVNVPSLGALPQCDTSVFDFQVDGCQFGIFRSSTQDIHGFNFWVKCAQTVWYPTAPAENTTLNGAHSAAATSLTVVAGTGIVTGDVLTIDPGFTGCEIVKVASVSGTTVTLDAHTPLRLAHASGAEVFRGGVVASFANGYNNLKLHEFHGRRPADRSRNRRRSRGVVQQPLQGSRPSYSHRCRNDRDQGHLAADVRNREQERAASA